MSQSWFTFLNQSEKQGESKRLREENNESLLVPVATSSSSVPPPRDRIHTTVQRHPKPYSTIKTFSCFSVRNTSLDIWSLRLNENEFVLVEENFSDPWFYIYLKVDKEIVQIGLAKSSNATVSKQKDLPIIEVNFSQTPEQIIFEIIDKIRPFAQNKSIVVKPLNVKKYFNNNLVTADYIRQSPIYLPLRKGMIPKTGQLYVIEQSCGRDWFEVWIWGSGKKAFLSYLPKFNNPKEWSSYISQLQGNSREHLALITGLDHFTQKGFYTELENLLVMQFKRFELHNPYEKIKSLPCFCERKELSESEDSLRPGEFIIYNPEHDSYPWFSISYMQDYSIVDYCFLLKSARPDATIAKQISFIEFDRGREADEIDMLSVDFSQSPENLLKEITEKISKKIAMQAIPYDVKAEKVTKEYIKNQPYFKPNLSAIINSPEKWGIIDFSENWFEVIISLPKNYIRGYLPKHQTREEQKKYKNELTSAQQYCVLAGFLNDLNISNFLPMINQWRTTMCELVSKQTEPEEKKLTEIKSPGSTSSKDLLLRLSENNLGEEKRSVPLISSVPQIPSSLELKSKTKVNSSKSKKKSKIKSKTTRQPESKTTIEPPLNIIDQIKKLPCFHSGDYPFDRVADDADISEDQIIEYVIKDSPYPTEPHWFHVLISRRNTIYYLPKFEDLPESGENYFEEFPRKPWAYHWTILMWSLYKLTIDRLHSEIQKAIAHDLGISPQQIKPFDLKSRSIDPPKDHLTFSRGKR